LPNVELLTALGNDAKGRTITDICSDLGIITDNIYICNNSEKDNYLAIEDMLGLKAAIAHVKNVEEHSQRILKPLENGLVKTNPDHSHNLIVLDGNLTQATLLKIAKNKKIMNYDVRIASASTSKAIRLKPFLSLPNVTIYCNKTEAENLCELSFKNTTQASTHLIKKGVGRAIVTNGDQKICDSSINHEPIAILPPKVKNIRHVTGAGDYFLACHIINEFKQSTKAKALAQAAESASKYVETEIK
jgi:sugar/nucleoside kinase (ribokinase family)